MKKSDIVATLAKNSTDIKSVAESKRIVDELFNILTSTIGTGEPVTIKGFGSFSVKERSGVSVLNGNTPYTTKVIKFTPAVSLKNTVKS